MNPSKTAVAEWRRFWFLPIVSALGYATSVLHVYGFGPFIEPLQQEFGWSRAQASLGITISAFLSGVFGIPIGILVDRIGPRRVGLIGVVLMGTAVGLLGTATGGMANWAGLWLVVAAGTLFVQATVWTGAVASRFEASRGLAIAIALSGASVAATVFPLLGTWLIGTYGWRTAFAALPAIWVIVVFPLLLLFFRGAQDDRRRKPATPEHEAPAAVLEGLTLKEGLRTPALYKLLLAAGFFAFTAIGAVVHFVPILKDRGADPLTAAGIASLVGIFSIIGRIGTGMLLDRFRSHVVGALAFLLPIFGCLLLLLDGSNPMSQMLAAAILGLTVGSEVDVIAYLTAKHFGLKNFGALYGAMLFALGSGTAFGPLAAGAVFDHYSSYSPFLMLTIALMTISSISLLSLGPTPRMAGTVPQVH